MRTVERKIAELAETERRQVPRVPFETGRRLRIIYRIETKVVGVTYLNDDGSQRQTIIQRCVAGEELKLVRQPQCPVDPAAIAVFRIDGEQLGYLAREFSADGTAAKMDAGETFHCCITSIVGGDNGKSFGVKVQVSNNDWPERHTSLQIVPYRPDRAEPDDRSRTLYWTLVLVGVVIVLAYMLLKLR